MTVTIKASDELDLELFPDDEEVEIIQNILTIIKTLQGSCPNYRDYGLDPDILHKPIPVAKAAYTVALSRQIAAFEPRAEVVDITYETDARHPEILYPIVEVMINEQE